MTRSVLARRPGWRVVAAWLTVCLVITCAGPVRAAGATQETPPSPLDAARQADAFDAAIRAALAAFASGSYDESVRLYRRALADPRRAQASLDEARRATILDGFGQALGHAGQHREAADLLRQALDIRTRLSGPDHPDVATVLEHLGAILLEQGDRAQARVQAERALAIREQAADPGQPADPQLNVSLNLMGDVLWFEGQLAQAEAWYARAVCVGQRTLGPLHPLVAVHLRNFANAIRRTRGDTVRAGAMLEWSLRIAERALGAAHPEVAGTLNDLAVVARSTGDYRTAQRYYERALQAIDARLGPRHLWAAAVRHNLAQLCQRLGDVDRAIRLEQEAAAIWSRTLGRTHANVGRAASALGGMYADVGQDARARQSYLRAIAIREQRLGPNHEDVAVTRNALATLLVGMGRLDEAWTQNARALAIWENAGASTDPWYLDALAVRGGLQAARGDLPAARATLEQAVRTQARVFGRGNPDLGRLRITFSEVLSDLGLVDEALREAMEAEVVGREHLQLTMRDLSERVALGYAAARPKGLDLAVSIASRQDEASAARARLVFDELVRSRGVVLEEMAARHRGEVAGALPPRAAALAGARQRLANLIVRGPEGLAPDRYLALVEQARVEKEQAERALAEVSEEFRSAQRRSLVTLAEVAAALPARTALVSFLRFDRYRGHPVGASPAGSRDRTNGGRANRQAIGQGVSSRMQPAYAAFILRGGSADVTMVPIGPASVVDEEVRRWRREVRSGLLRADRTLAQSERAAQAAGRTLRRRIWDPLVPHLGDAPRLFIVPDGTLNLVAFGALPLDPPSNAFLVEEGPTLHVLSAERDLVLPDVQPRAGHGLLALGAPSFGAATAAALCPTLQSMRFDALPGSLREVQEVARIWQDAGERSAELLSRGAASERAFKMHAPGRRVLHLATHGFFLDESCDLPSAPATRIGATRAVGGLSTKGAKPGSSAASGTARTPRIDNPLMLSGLAFAGANRRARVRADEDDGLLTAEEVAGLNLDGVEWAVLSACDTGIGAIKSGEGVFGLRRAFQIAGVRTVILSLWAVEDRSAVDWMRALYDHRRRGGLDTADAVRAASLDVLRQRRSRGASTHPFFWAGFVAAGDWR